MSDEYLDGITKRVPKDAPSATNGESPDEWYEREKTAFRAWWESEGEKTFSRTPTLAAGAGWFARAEAAPETAPIVPCLATNGCTTPEWCARNGDACRVKTPVSETLEKVVAERDQLKHALNRQIELNTPESSVVGELRKVIQAWWCGSMDSLTFKRRTAEILSAPSATRRIELQPNEIDALIGYHLQAGAGASLQDDFNGSSEHNARIKELRLLKVTA